MLHQMKIMNRLGDATLTWNVDVQEQVEEAQRQFEELVNQGYLAAKSLGGGQHEMITEFDPEATRILVMPPIVGG